MWKEKCAKAKGESRDCRWAADGQVAPGFCNTCGEEGERITEIGLI
jgi:hypothetical protein